MGLEFIQRQIGRLLNRGPNRARLRDPDRCPATSCAGGGLAGLTTFLLDPPDPRLAHTKPRRNSPRLAPRITGRKHVATKLLGLHSIPPGGRQSNNHPIFALESRRMRSSE